MCVALYRALQYEAGDRKWLDGFRSCILDIGVTAYDMLPSRDPATGNRTRIINIKRGSFDMKKVGQILLYTICPVLPMLKVQDELNRKRGRVGGGIVAKVVAGSVMLLFVSWFLFMFLDHLPLSENLQEWGSIMGNPESTSGNTRYYLSNRWGYYHQWANKDSERSPGDAVKWNVLEGVSIDTDGNRTVDPNAKWFKGQERGIELPTANPAVLRGVGERFAFNYRIAVIGWFFFFMFVTYLVSLRSDVRVVMKIQGTLVEDFLVCLFWPLALWQMEDTIVNGIVNAEKVKEVESFMNTEPQPMDQI